MGFEIEEEAEVEYIYIEGERWIDRSNELAFRLVKVKAT